MDSNTLVSAATQILPDTPRRRITITDPYGGRGFDYDVRDESANSEGGLLVIALTVPAGRDWIQWKGRTARGDRKGQLSVILSREDPIFELVKESDLKSAHRNGNDYSSALIDTLLEQHDRGTGEKLRNQEELTYMGQRLNELCDHYHQMNRDTNSPVGTVKLWPRQAFHSNDNKLSDFIASQENSSPKIQQFMDSLYPTLHYTSKYDYNADGFPVEPKYTPPPKQVAFLVDYSSSMDGQRIQNAIDNVARLIESPDYFFDDDFISFARFDHEYDQVFPMTLKQNNVQMMLSKVRACRNEVKGATRFYDAINTCMSQLNNASCSHWTVALTDGASSNDEIGIDQTISNINRYDHMYCTCRCESIVNYQKLLIITNTCIITHHMISFNLTFCHSIHIFCVFVCIQYSSSVNLQVIGFHVDSHVEVQLKKMCNSIQEPKVGKYVYAGDNNALDEAFSELGDLISGPVLMT